MGLIEDLIKKDIEEEEEEERIREEEYLIIRKNDLIACVEREIYTDWTNGKRGRFRDFYYNYEYRFCETDENGNSDLFTKQEQINSPVIACGFVAYLIKHREDGTEEIFNNYFNYAFLKYTEFCKHDPNAANRDLENEFYCICWKFEEDLIKHSEALFEFITDEETNLIKTFVDNYKVFIQSKVNEYIVTLKQSVQQIQPLSDNSLFKQGDKTDSLTQPEDTNKTGGEDKPQRIIDEERLKKYLICDIFNKKGKRRSEADELINNLSSGYAYFNS